MFQIKRGTGTFCFRDANSLVAVISALFINLLIWAFLYLKVQPDHDPFYLHYNIYFGVDLIGSWYRMYIMPLSGFVFIAFNAYLSCSAGKYNKIAGRLIIWTSVLLQVILLAAAYLIIEINS